MRSGQYKISQWKISLEEDKITSGGRFRTSCKDLPPLNSSLAKHKTPLQFNTSLNSLSPQNGKPLRHKSCEHIERLKDPGHGSRHRPNKSLSHKGGHGYEEANADQCSPGGWEIGRVISVPIRNRLKGALSHSALNTVQPGSDVACYGSTSSGYSSSSSSYGSFKSCCSGSSSLPRITVGAHFQSVKSDSSCHNPLYDTTPPMPASLKSEPDSSLLYDSLSGDNYLLSMSSDDPSEVSECADEDPIARQCKEYFEKRLVTFRSFCKHWSSQSSDLHAPEDSGVEEGNSSGMDSLELKEDSLDFVKEKIHGTQKKTDLETKMDFLRQEMACLMDQDNALFKQLLALHDSISTLNTRSATGPALRPYTPSSVDTEEEDATKEKIKKARSKKLSFRGVFDFGVISTPMGDVRKVDGDDDDEGHFTDLSFSQSSPSHSPSPPSTISSHSSKDSFKRGGVLGNRVYDLPLENNPSGLFTRSRKSYAPTARNRRRSSSVHQTKPAPTMEYGGTTALVLVHTNDMEVLLKGAKKYQTISQPSTLPIPEKAKLKYSASSKSGTFFNLDSISFLPHTTNQPSKPLVFNSSCRQTSPKTCNKSNSSHTHPPYREALIM